MGLLRGGGLDGLHQFSQCQEGVEGDGGNGRWRREWNLYPLSHWDGPDLGDGAGSYLGVADDVAGWLATGGFEDALENGRLSCQGVSWMYNPHNLRIFYRYRGFI
jgi:hypothetical protein